MLSLPAVYSTLSEQALLEQLLPLYLGNRAAQCRFLTRGMNDTYLVRTVSEQYILRVYRAGWRTLADIRYELDMLQHLHTHGVRVAAPVARLDGELVTTVAAPEGARHAALFTFAPGAYQPLSVTTSAEYGREAARMHRALDSFRSPHERFALDRKHLLDDRAPWILPLLEHRPDDRAFVERLWRFLQEEIAGKVPHLTWAPCHGDLNGGNCHIDHEGRVTFFDFDCAGPGWRSYDLAVFNWSVRDMKDRELGERLWHAYLHGYQTEQAVAQADLAAMGLFVGARQLWLVGLHCQHANVWGWGNLSDAYFDRRLTLLRSLMREQDWP